MFSLFNSKEPAKSGDDDLDFLLGLADDEQSVLEDIQPAPTYARHLSNKDVASSLVVDNAVSNAKVPLLDMGPIADRLKFIKGKITRRNPVSAVETTAVLPAKGSMTSRAADCTQAAPDSSSFLPVQPHSARDHVDSSDLPDFLRQKRGVARGGVHAALPHGRKAGGNNNNNNNNNNNSSSKPRESKEVEQFIKKFRGIPGVITSPRQLVLAESRKYDETTGLFSTYETSAARESRKDTYLTQNLQKKLSSMRDAELAREAGEKSRLARLRVQQAKREEERFLEVKRKQDMSEWLSLKYKVLEATSAKELQASMARHRLAGDAVDKVNGSLVSSTEPSMDVKPESSVERRMQIVKEYDRVNRERSRAVQARRAREMERRRIEGADDDREAEEAAAAAAAAEAEARAAARKRRVVNNKRRAMRAEAEAREKAAQQQIQQQPLPPRARQPVARAPRGPAAAAEAEAGFEEWEFYADPANRWSLSDVPINREVIQSPPQSAASGLCSDRVERAQMNASTDNAAAGGELDSEEEEFVCVDLNRTYESDSDESDERGERALGLGGELGGSSPGDPSFFTHPLVAQEMRRAQTDELYRDWDAETSQPYLRRGVDADAETDPLEMSNTSFGGGLTAENAVTFYNEGAVVAGALATCD